MSDLSYSLVVSEMSALDESSRELSRGTFNSREFTSREASSRAEDFSTFSALVKKKREKTSAMTFGKVGLLVWLGGLKLGPIVVTKALKGCALRRSADATDGPRLCPKELG